MTIATIRRVPVDLIIHSLAERFDPSKNDGAEEFTDNALSLGLYACIDSNGLAEEWAVSGGVAQTAEWMATVITDCDSWREPTAAETRVAEVAVCKRLLVTACNLCVTQDAEDHAAATALVQAASRILGVDVSRIIRTSADVEGYKDAMALQAAREQLQAALGRTPDAPPLTLRELINCLASKHTAAEMALQRARFNAQSLLDKATRGRDSMCAERDRLRAQVDRMITAMREDAPTAKTKPQPGDMVPWADVEDGCLYFDAKDGDGAAFLAHHDGRWFWLYDDEDGDLGLLLRSGYGSEGRVAYANSKAGGILVASDLGTDPEAWRKAMREWEASKR